MSTYPNSAPSPNTPGTPTPTMPLPQLSHPIDENPAQGALRSPVPRSPGPMSPAPMSPGNAEARPLSSVEGDPFRSRQGTHDGSFNGAESRDPYQDRGSRLSPASVDRPDYFTMPMSAGAQDLHRNGSVGFSSQPLPPLPSARIIPSLRRNLTGDTRISMRPHSVIDHVVPLDEEKPTGPSSVSQRLKKTIEVAGKERDKYARQAWLTGWLLNAAIFLQVLLGSLTTGLSAVATSGKSAAVQTTILGGLSTIVASYLARARGSNEPELSIARTKDLEQFLRECAAFDMDHGYVTSNEFDKDLDSFRKRFEELLGNANGERRLAPPINDK